MQAHVTAPALDLTHEGPVQAAADSFGECAVTRVASMSITNGAAVSIPACGACAPANSHTRARAAARAVLIAFNAGVSVPYYTRLERGDLAGASDSVLDAERAAGCRVSIVAESGAVLACSNGRPRLTQDQDRRLFAESAGTCLLCNARLFAELPDGSRSVSIAERAHVVAHSDLGPRADRTVSEEERSDPANIVLLCPTCHTQVDKASDRFPVKDLFSRKAARAAAVALVGGTPVFETRSDARRAVKAALERNRLIFSNYGPDANDGSIPSTEEAERWSRHVLEDMVPGNELVVAIVRINEPLTTPEDQETAELLRLHTRDLAEKHRGQPVTAPARRFPAAAVHLFNENEHAES